METSKNINRREALRRTAMVMGTALSASTIAGIMQGCKADPELAWTPTYFEEGQAMFVSVLAGTIIPRTATPGAREVGVPGFIEEMVSKVYDEKRQEEFMAGLSSCRQWCEQTAGDQFISLAPEKQLELAESLDAYAKALFLGAEQDVPSDELTKKAASFFREMKELTVSGFFTSEVGATQVLQYKAIPVEYHGCLPLSEVGRTWAT